MVEYVANFDSAAAGPAPSGTTTVDDYSASISDGKSLLKDPRFLADLRQYYREHFQEDFASDEDLVDRFYEDRNYADLNSVSAVRDAVRTSTATEDQRLRMRRIENVWRSIPGMFSSGGRGFGAVGDVAEAVVTDPLNLIPGLGAMKAGGQAARLALMGRKTGRISGNATAAALTKGAKTGAISEGVLSGVQEGVINTAQQVRDTDLGFQDEFSYGKLGRAVGMGAGIGVGIGSLIGVGGGAIGRMGAGKQLEELRLLGYSDDEIARMAPSLSEAINPIGRAAVDVSGPDEPSKFQGEAGAVLRAERGAVKRGDRADPFAPRLEDQRPEVERAAEAAPEAPELSETQLREQEALSRVGLDPEWKPKLNTIITNLRNEIDDELAKGGEADAEIVETLRKQIDEAQSLRETNSRLGLEAEEILVGLGSDDIPTQTKARGRQVDLERSVENLRAAIRAHNEGRPVDTALLGPGRRETDAPGQPVQGSAQADVNPAETAENQGSQVESPDQVSDAGANPDVEVVSPDEPGEAIVYTRNQADVTKRILDEEGLTETDLQTMISDGRIALTNGKFSRESVKSLRAALKGNRDTAAFKETMAPEADAPQAEAAEPAARRLDDAEIMAELAAIKDKLAPLAIVSPENALLMARGIARKRALSEGFDEEDLLEAIAENQDRLVDRPGEVSMNIDDVDFLAGASESEKRKYRQILRELKDDPENEDVDDFVLQAMARKMLDENVAYEPLTDIVADATSDEGAAFAQRQARRFGTGQRSVEAKNIEGAGRSANTGKIQTILRRGVPTTFEQDTSGKWRVVRSVTADGIDRRTESINPARYMNRQAVVVEAKNRERRLARLIEDPKGEKARFKKDIRAAAKANGEKLPADEVNARADAAYEKEMLMLEERGTIIEYSAEAGEKLIRQGGGPVDIAQKGQPAFWDSLQNRAFASEDAALEARGYGYKVDTAAQRKETASGATAEEINELAKKYADDPVRFVDEVEKLMAKSAADGSPTARPDADVPSAGSGEQIAAAKYTDPDTGATDYRMVSTKQADRGVGVDKIIGQRGGPMSDIGNWEVRYVDRNTARTKVTIEAAFNAADPMPVGADAAGALGKRTGSMGGYGNPIDLSTDEADKIVPELTPAEKEFIRQALPVQGGRGAQKFFVEGADPSYTDLLTASVDLEKAPWRSPEEMEQGLEALELIYRKMTEVAPQGHVFNSQHRDDAVQQVGRIFDKFAPEETEEAKRFLNDLGGSQQHSPIFDEADSQWRYRQREDGSSLISLGAQPSGTRTHLSALFHETAHWAYHNILTPQDRLEFWEAIRSGYIKDGAIDNQAIRDRGIRGMNGGELTETVYGETSPQEFFADQFAMWALQRSSDGVWKDAGYWQKMGRYVKAVFDRFYDKKAIDPNLEPLFSKILPEKERMKFKDGFVGEPVTDAGKYHKLHFEEIDHLERGLQAAIRGGDQNEIITQAELLRNWLAGRFAHERSEMPGVPGSNNFYKGITPGHYKILRHRLLDLNEVLSGARFKDKAAADQYVAKGVVPEQFGNDADAWLADALPESSKYREVMDDIRDQQGTAAYTEQLDGSQVISVAHYADAAEDIIDMYEGAWTPSTGNVKPSSIEKGYSNLTHLFKILREDLNASYHLAEGTDVQTVPDSVARKQLKARRAGINKKQQRSQQQTAGDLDRAAETARTPRNKRAPRKSNRPELGEADAASLRGMSPDQLADEFKRHEGTGRGDQIAAIIDEKMKTYPLEMGPPEGNKMYAWIKGARKGELVQRYREAWRTGDMELEEQIAFEVTRRIYNKANKDAKISAAVMEINDTNLRRLIDVEIGANTGVSYDDGIPAQAPARVKSFLSPITHRDPIVQKTARTMMYRMLNLAGKATDKMGEVNVMTVAEVARLANVTPEGAPNAVFADMRNGNYGKLRSDLRRMAVGLNKGEVGPIEVMHEVSHAVLRAGNFPDVERQAIVSAFDAADDQLKERAFAAAQKNYPGQAEAQLREIAAEEWFVEGFSQYLARRVSKNDAFKMSEQGSLEDIRLRGDLDRALDRLVEYVAYVTNGLIGRNDIKQTYRRMMFYGDVFEKPVDPVYLSQKKRLAVPVRDAAAFAENSFRYAPQNRTQAITAYVDTGNPMTMRGGKPVVFYHGTPWGAKFDKNEYPNVIMKPTPSARGVHGRGVYLALDPTESDYYGNMPTFESWRREIESKNLTADEKEDALLTAEMWSDAQSDVVALERKLADLEARSSGDLLGGANDIADFEAAEQIPGLKEDIAFAKETASFNEATLVDNYGLTRTPEVLPLYVHAEQTARFDNTPVEADDGLIMALVTELQGKGHIQDEPLAGFFESFEGAAMPGHKAFAELVNALQGPGGLSRENANEAITSSLENIGYDSMQVMHFGHGPEGSMTPGMVVFDSKNVKHVEADVFDANDDRLYYSDFHTAANTEIGRGVLAAAKGQDASVSMYLDETVPPPVAGGMNKIEAGKSLDQPEVEALHKAHYAQIQTNSSRMISVGMKKMGQWFKEYHPRHHRMFASKYFPMKDQLLALPDAPGALKSWAKKVAAPLSERATQQPESWTRIQRALRRGTNSRHYANLSSQEKSVADSIYQQFRDERKALVEAGVYMGDRGDDYFPQVWDSKAIAKNGPEFRAAIADYFKAERRAAGASEDDIQNLGANSDFQEMVTNIYRTLADGENEGVVFPDEAKSISSGAENIDFARMIELDKYPDMLDALEPYLSNDLDFQLTKYFEASTRKQMMVEKFGLNNHGLHDYQKVMSGGKEAIVDLLSTNKVYRRESKTKTPDGEFGEYTLVNTTEMPYANNVEEADAFATLLLETHQTQGRPAAKQLLDMIGPEARRGEAAPLPYQKRTEAILDALDDSLSDQGHGFRRIDSAEYDHVERMLQVYNKRPVGDPGLIKASRVIRTVNNLSLLSFTTLTSLGDVVLPVIRSGRMGAAIKGWSKMASDPEYRKMIRNTGVAIENIMHERMIHGYGGSDSKISQAFFNGTMLTPWTDMQRRISGAVAHEAFKAEQSKAFRHYVPGQDLEAQPPQYKQAWRMLRNYGLEDYSPTGSLNESFEMDEIMQSPRFQDAIIKFTNEAIFTPNADDVPYWAQTPIGTIVAQLKTFPLMISRMGKEILWNDTKLFLHDRNVIKLDNPESVRGTGNPTRAAYFLTLGPAAGYAALNAKDVIQGRGGEENREHKPRDRGDSLQKLLGYNENYHGDLETYASHYLEGMLLMGGLGLLGDILHSTVQQADNGAYGQLRVVSTLLGPSVGLVTDTVGILGGVKDYLTDGDENGTGKERAAVRDAVRRVPIIGGMGSVREAITDAAFEKSKKGSWSGSAGWSRGSNWNK